MVLRFLKSGHRNIVQNCKRRMTRGGVTRCCFAVQHSN
jgi:hypothetical protein